MRREDVRGNRRYCMDGGWRMERVIASLVGVFSLGVVSLAWAIDSSPVSASNASRALWIGQAWDTLERTHKHADLVFLAYLARRATVPGARMEVVEAEVLRARDELK